MVRLSRRVFRKLAAAALARSAVRPVCTLYHADLPQALEDKGGWQSKDTSKAFGDYAGYVAGKLGPLVKNYMTMNEMSSFIDIGYQDGRHAPGLMLPPGKVAQAR